MATELKSQEQLIETFKNEVQLQDPTLTDFSDGSSNNAFAGISAVAVRELQKLTIQKFNNTFFSTAKGSATSASGDDELQTLATDHFGDNFKRPAATKATGTANFTRPNADAGDVTIPVDTIVKTVQNANGEEERFITLAEVTMTGTSINASVEAVEAGSDGNVNAAKVIVIEDSLTDDTVVVTNTLAFVGGDEEADDSEYLEFLRNEIEKIRGATAAAIKAAALNVAGVEFTTPIENQQVVIEFDIGGSSTIGTFFRIPRVQLFIADVNGTASAALIALVVAAIEPIRATGVKIDTIGATPLLVDWTASIVLNPSGPNFAALSVAPTLITDAMSQFIKDLPIGTGFIRSAANAAILAIFGPSGTDDLTSFVTSIPSGDIAATATDKLIPDTIAIV